MTRSLLRLLNLRCTSASGSTYGPLFELYCIDPVLPYRVHILTGSDHFGTDQYWPAQRVASASVPDISITIAFHPVLL